MNTSFKDYLSRRQNMKIIEMAADAVGHKDDAGNMVKQEEVRKTPIFFDQEDIDYLYQFPPRLWKQALAARYGSILHDYWKKLQSGTTVNDVMDVVLKDRSRKIIFKDIKTNINSLYEKLVEDVDDTTYSELTPEKKKEFLAQSRGQGRSGSYGFVLTNFRRDNKLGVSEGYVELKENEAKNRLGQYLRAIQQGWFTRVPDGHDGIDPNKESKVVEFGGRNKKNLPVFDADELKTKFRGMKHVGVKDTGELVWQAYLQNGSPIRFVSHMPILKPAFMVPTSSHRRFTGNAITMHQIRSDVKSGNLQSYIDLADPQKKSVVVSRIDHLDKWLEENESKHSRKKNKSKTKDEEILDRQVEQKKKERAHLKRTQQVVEKLKSLVSNLLNPEVQNEKAKRFRELSSSQNQELSENQKRINKLEYESLKIQLNIVRLLKATNIKPENPEGALNNSQIFKMLMVALHNEIQVQSHRLQIQSPRHDIHDWNMHHFNPRLRNAHTSWTGYGTWNPNWQQPESVHGSLKKYEIEADEFWKYISEFLVSVNQLDKESINPKVKRFEDPGTFEDLGTLADGINSFLNQSRIYKTPVYYAMMKNWWQIFDNASNHFRKLIGSRYFLQFLPHYKAFKSGEKKANDPQVKQAIKFMKEGAKKAGQNYAQMVYQLKKRQVQSAENLSKVLLFPSNLQIEILTKSFMQRWNRSVRQEDPNMSAHQQHGMTSHGIGNLYRILDDREIKRFVDTESSRAANNPAVASFAAQGDNKEKSMMEDIVQTGMAFIIFRNIFVLAQKYQNKDVNIDDANEYANRILDDWMKRKGIRPYKGAMVPNSQTLQAVAQRQKQEEDEIRSNIRSSLEDSLEGFGYTADEIKEILKKIQEDPAAFIERGRELQIYLNSFKDLKTLFKLSMNNPNRRKDWRSALETKVQRRDFGWKVIDKMLKAADELKSEPE